MMARVTKMLTIAALALVCTGSLEGCSYQKQFETSPNDYGTRQYSDGDRTIESRPNALFIQSATDHRNRSITYSRSASDAVAAMKGVREAFVIVTDKNAYAAVVLDQTATGIKGTGTVQISDNTITSNRFHQQSESRTLKPGVVVTDKYSNIVVPEHDGLSTDFLAQAQATILEQHPNLHGVFISANPHFINELSMLAHTAWQGLSLQDQDRLDDFNGMVQQIFGTPDRLLDNER